MGLCKQSSHRPRAGPGVTGSVTPYIPDAPRNCQIKFLVINWIALNINSNEDCQQRLVDRQPPI
jgi:hypothetical protein